jgi:hypothetical protein
LGAAEEAEVEVWWSDGRTKKLTTGANRTVKVSP